MFDRLLMHIHTSAGATYRDCEWYAVKEPREGVNCLRTFLNGAPSGRILALSGLQKTGKTTLLSNALRFLPDAELDRFSVVRATGMKQTQLLEILYTLRVRGATHVAIEDITDMEEFTGVEALKPYARDMTLVISGEDTLYFNLEKTPCLDVIRMTHIPAREYMRLHGATVQECYQLGGMAFSPEEIRRWMKNVPDGLKKSDSWLGGKVTGNLRRSLVRMACKRECAAMCVGIPEKVLQREGYQAALEAVGQAFPGKDLSLVEAKVDKECHVSGGTAKTARLLLEVAEYLVRVREETPERRSGWRWLPVQLGLRRLQAEDGVNYCLDSSDWEPEDDKLSWQEKRELQKDMADRLSKVMNDLLMLDLVLLDTVKAAPANVIARSLMLSGHRRGMLVLDRVRRRCAVFLAADASPNSSQAAPLRDPGTIAGLSRRFGAVVRRVVLCHGGGMESDGVEWQDAAEYLSLLGDPAALRRMCCFSVADRPAAPADRTARRPAEPMPVRPRPLPQIRRFERDSVFDGLRLDTEDRHRLLDGESVSLSHESGHFLFRTAIDRETEMELVEEHLDAAILRRSGLSAPETRLGRWQGLISMLTPLDDRPFTPAPMPVLAGSFDEEDLAYPNRIFPCGVHDEEKMRAMDGVAKWAAGFGVEKAFWTLAVLDAFMGNHDRPREGWGLTPEGKSYWRLFMPRGNRARLLHIPRGKNSVTRVLFGVVERAVWESSRKIQRLKGMRLAATTFKLCDPVEDIVASLFRQRIISGAENACWREAIYEAGGYGYDIAERLWQIEDGGYY